MTTTTDTMLLDDLTAAERADLRRLARGVRGCPVVVLDGFRRPTARGDAAHYTTPTGRLITYPRAYGRKAYNMVYHPSTARVEVGRLWLIRWRATRG